MPGQVPEPEKTRRSERLFGIEEKYRKAYEEGLLGSLQEVLVEEKTVIEGKEYYAGHTKTYVKIVFPVPETAPSLENTLVTVIPKEWLWEAGLLTGTPENT